MAPKTEKFQGWANAQTWCVALTLDNTKEFQDRAMEIVRQCKPQSCLRAYCRSLSLEIHTMAPWAWSIMRGVDADLKLVKWHEIYQHYQDKVEEQTGGPKTYSCGCCDSLTRITDQKMVQWSPNDPSRIAICSSCCDEIRQTKFKTVNEFLRRFEP